MFDIADSEEVVDLLHKPTIGGKGVALRQQKNLLRHLARGLPHSQVDEVAHPGHERPRDSIIAMGAGIGRRTLYKITKREGTSYSVPSTWYRYAVERSAPWHHARRADAGTSTEYLILPTVATPATPSPPPAQHCPL